MVICMDTLMLVLISDVDSHLMVIPTVVQEDFWRLMVALVEVYGPHLLFLI